jgi:hypothetical protein
MVRRQPSPLITVLMTTYNGELWVEQAVNSILGQTFRDWELLVVDDGSTDRTPAILRRLAASDPRIRIEVGPRTGTAEANNRGIASSRGALIARLDQDDLSLPDRLEQQARFMDTHPDVGLLGGWLRTFGAASHLWSYPGLRDSIRAQMLFRCPFGDPTVMIRRSALDVLPFAYDRGFEPAEDYDLWERMSRCVPTANLPRVLSLYRLHPDQLSVASNDQNAESTRRIQSRLLQDLGVDAASSDLALHFSLVAPELRPSGVSLGRVAAWLEGLAKANLATSAFPEPAFQDQLVSIWRSNSRATPDRSVRLRLPATTGGSWRIARRVGQSFRQRAIRWRELARTSRFG